ncbi:MULTISPECIES: TetR/AcrR family transcriptional regulator [Prauserella salsuginis group]|uniref:TetR family transcriptional regulator n=1 Tax=Prauserella salsuginis TaxID=387889 RepID=A0ABW6G0A0_9PSEU|nr:MULTISPECIES: TetR/AcrR family transcriptional regulator [Prauserella salsuginis group]MCR3721235.1 transcriptional regulator, TetR family [Prauserella flava]MCR3734684.1 transcriptional regulator, TetR family [Prauserella salsuginis]
MVAESDASRRPRRQYESPVRQERAERTRAHVIATAGRLFAEHGYAATSMRRIAAEAEVGLETVTQTGRKANLLLAAFRSGFAGDPDAVDITALIGGFPGGAEPGHTEPGSAGAGGGTDLVEAITTATARLADGLRDSLGIWRAFTVAAAADETVAAARAELAGLRRREITTWLEAPESAGMLPTRDATSRARLADMLGLLTSHDAYDHLVTVCGWPHDDFASWTSAAILDRLRSP